MKTQILVLALMLAFGASLLARGATYTACTKDSKSVSLTIEVADDAPASVDANIQAAFTSAAQGLTAEALVSYEGFLVFAEKLSDEAREAISVGRPPAVLDGACK